MQNVLEMAVYLEKMLAAKNLLTYSLMNQSTLESPADS